MYFEGPPTIILQIDKIKDFRREAFNWASLLSKYLTLVNQPAACREMLELIRLNRKPDPRFVAGIESQVVRQFTNQSFQELCWTAKLVANSNFYSGEFMAALFEAMQKQIVTEKLGAKAMTQVL